MKKLLEFVRCTSSSTHPVRTSLSLSDVFGLQNSDEGTRSQLAYLTRGQVAGSFTAGGSAIGETIGPVAASLFPSSAVIQAGATVRHLKRHTALPRVSIGVSSSWVAECEAIPDGNLAFAQVGATSHRLGAVLLISKQQLAQTPEIAEPLMRNELLNALAYSIDVAALSGLGGVEPMGILNTPGISEAVTFGEASTRADFTLAEKTVADAFCEREGRMTFISSTGTRKILRETHGAGFAGCGKPLWSDENTIIGHRAIATPAISNGDGRVVYGAFEDLQITFFPDVEVIRDPFTYDTQAKLEIVVNLRADISPIRHASFVRSTNAPTA